MAKDRPSFDTFLNDPEFQSDRELLDKYFEHFLTRKEKEAKERKDAEDAKNLTIFDRLFGGL